MSQPVFLLLWSIPTLYFGPKLGRQLFLPILSWALDPILLRLYKRAEKRTVDAKINELKLRAAWEVVAMEDEKEHLLGLMQDAVEDAQFRERMKFEAGWDFNRQDDGACAASN